MVLARLSGQIGMWINEITHAGNETFGSDPVVTYLALIPLLPTGFIPPDDN